MGCHTWFAKKVERDYETAKGYALEDIQKNLDIAIRMLNNPNENDLKMIEAYKWDASFLNRMVKIGERQIRMVNKNLCKVAVMNRQPEHSFYNEHGFFILDDDNLPHDIFRIGFDRKFEKPYNTYCNVYLYSMDETIKFINEQFKRAENDLPYWFVTLNEAQIKQLNKFWQEYPDGCIHFG